MDFPSEPLTVLRQRKTIPVYSRWFGSWRISIDRRAFTTLELRHNYDKAAPLWSRLLHRLSFPSAYEKLLCRALPDDVRSARDKPLRVLDCGIGTGALTIALTRVCSTPLELSGIDLSPRMLELARYNLRDVDSVVSLCQSDVRKLPYNDKTFDLVMTSHVLEHLPCPSVALSEMVRVLRPNGVLLACFTRNSPLGFYVHLKWRIHRMTPAKARSLFLDSALTYARCLPIEHNLLCRQLSLACIGRKPSCERQNEA